MVACRIFSETLARRGLMEYDEMEGIAWEWQSADGTQGKALLALEAVGPNPTDRGKNGSKRNLLVDANGIPLSLVATGANRHDSAVLVDFGHAESVEQNLCLDAGYFG